MTLYCIKCGAQLPDGAAFCYKCGAQVGPEGTTSQSSPRASASQQVLAPSGVAQLKCPTCGAPLSPKFGEMVITCEYCGGTVTLGEAGWREIQKNTMLPLKLVEKEAVIAAVRSMMDQGFLRRHLQESSVLEELNLSVVPYWIIPVSARTSIVAADAVAEVGSIATTAALFGLMAGGMGNRRGGMGGAMMEGAVLGTVLGGGGGRNATKTVQLDNNYEFPVVALKALTEYQPHDYQFDLGERQIFDVAKFPKGIRALNGDVGEEVAKYQAKALVDQAQARKAHSQYHMIQQMNTQMEVGEGEMLHVPVWFVRYDHKGSKIVLVVDGNSGLLINSIGL